MVTSPHWADAARSLREIPVPDWVQIGLHLTLTDQPAVLQSPVLAPEVRYLGLGQLTRALHFRKVSREEIDDHLNQQWNNFTRDFGRPPDFIDGHHHVHQLPVIREAILDFAASFPLAERPWIRTCWEAPGRLISRRVTPLKAMFVGWYGRALRRQCRARGIATNLGFAGVYDFSSREAVSSLMDRFCRNAVDGTVIMCHPGFIDNPLREADSLVEPRRSEYDYLMSDAFRDLLDDAEITLQATSFFAEHS